jgi:hypothetical protein
MLLMEVLTTVLAIFLTIALSTFLLIVSFHFNWMGRLLPDLLLSGAIAILAILAYPPAQALPEWLRLAYWLLTFVGLRWLTRRVYRHAPHTETQERPSPPAAHPDPIVNPAAITAYFDFEEIIP